MPPKKRIFFGWWIVLASTLLNFLNGGIFFYGFTVFFNPIRNTFGWTAALTSLAFTLQRLESGIIGPLIGLLVDRVGPRKLMLAGWFVAALGFLWLSQINSLWAFYGAFLVLATGFSFAEWIPIQAAIVNWFSKKRSRAMAIAFTGYGASGILVPLLALSIERFDWRETLIFVSIAAAVIGIPLSALMRHRPGQYGYRPDGETEDVVEEADSTVAVPPSQATELVLDTATMGLTAREAMKTKAFWLLSLVAFFEHIGFSAVYVHIVPYLVSIQFASVRASTVVTGMTLCSLIGRLGFGFLGDFISKRYLMAIAFALQALGLVIFSLIDIERAWLVVLFLLIYAPGYGGPIPLRPALQADYFGTRSFGTILGLMSMVSLLSGLASPVIAGWIFDVTGSYRPAWQLFALITVPSIPLMIMAKPPKKD